MSESEKGAGRKQAFVPLDSNHDHDLVANCWDGCPGWTGREQARLEAAILSMFSVPAAIIGPPPPVCFYCTLTWRGFDGDDRSVCCGQSRTRLMEAHATARGQR